MPHVHPEIPSDLTASILRGDCVAFVGAGFSMPSVPNWPTLLGKLSEALAEMGCDVAEARGMLADASSDAATLELVATLLEAAAGDRFGEALASVIQPADADARKRVDWLHSIPFAAVLTTNFDGYLRDASRLRGDGSEGWHIALRRRGAWYDRYQGFEHIVAPEVPLIELHGSVRDPESRVVLTERAYRERLYGDARYLSLMRALLATRTLLFLGVSFTDAYVRLLLAETMTLLESSGSSEPIAYAILPDIAPRVANAYREQRGIEVISYDSGSNHSEFDRLLETLAEATSPTAALARVVHGRRVLWSDYNMQWNAWGVELLEKAGATVVKSKTADEALAIAAAAANEGRPFDLILTRYGHAELHARTILEATGVGRIEAPVIVFASGAYASENKRRAIGWGALDYVCGWTALFERIEMLFTDGETSASVPYRRRG